MENGEHEGIVTSIKSAHNPLENTYNILADMVLQTKSDIQLDLYDNVILADEKVKSIKNKAELDAYTGLLSKHVKTVDMEGNTKKIDLSGKEYAETAKKMLPELKKAADLLLKGLISGAPIVVRFHNDGDGSAGGIALYRAFAELQRKLFANERGISWEMNRSVVYTLESFYADKMLFESYESIEKPILLITDFGTSPESFEAIKASHGVCDIIWLDHHMPYEGFPRELVKHYINVCDFGGASSFTAGLLTCIFAQVLGDIDVEDLKEAALVSDYSTYANFKNEEATKNSIILDYLTSSSNETHNKPKQMDMLLKDKERSESTFRRANGIMEETIDAGIKNIKNYRNAAGINICVLDFSHIAKIKLDYPLPGRYSSKLQYKIEAMNNGKTVTIVHYGSYISMRSSNDILESVNILEMIERLKNATSGAVSGGGHRQAASIKTDREHIKEVIKLVLMELGVGAAEQSG